ncbi:metallophosphoesterase family protein [Brachybacterium saurashtrense]|uniref:Phosphohydrolase n=1 Tax=Brachybacterium saurashtrense TaxID=556288 RepID=A0A345YKI5_9MICO|nr:metallophosphoesterase [Brachybacterium saurashtrense]AXK44437.1 phosphohydrolase [Brachybacterium saurashtrense]RRR23049.1 phosphohydrolase [Brachybacterium saurashtrense]
MRILHLTDTHLYGDPDARHYDRIDPAAALRGLLARLDGLADIDAVVHTGDASEDGTPGSYRLLHEILDPVAAALEAPLAVVMGNHDVSAVYGETIAAGQRLQERQDRVVPLAGGGRIVLLDTSVPGAGYGHLETAQLDWLRDVLAEPAAQSTVLALHHPPLEGATALLRALDLDGLDALAEVLAGTDVRIVLAGHYHHAMDGAIAGIPVHVAPGVTNVVDPLAPGRHEQALALSGASLIELGEGAPRVITAVHPSSGDVLGDAEQPVYRFDPEQVGRIIAAAGR